MPEASDSLPTTITKWYCIASGSKFLGAMSLVLFGMAGDFLAILLRYYSMSLDELQARIRSRTAYGFVLRRVSSHLIFGFISRQKATVSGSWELPWNLPEGTRKSDLCVLLSLFERAFVLGLR